MALLTGLPGSGFYAAVGCMRTLSSVKLVRRRSAHLGKIPPCFLRKLTSLHVCKILERAYAAGNSSYPHACSVRCLRLKTQGILPRSEFTLLVTHCQVRTIVVCKCKAKLRRRDGDVKLVEHVAGSCDVLELSGGVRCVASCLSTLDFSENVCQDSGSLRVWVER